MLTKYKLLFIIFLLFGSSYSFAVSDRYRAIFLEKVQAFQKLNRISQGRLNHDIHADCKIYATLSITISADGNLVNVSVEESSTVPVFDRHLMWVVQQAAPYPPLDKYHPYEMEEVTFKQIFYLDARVWMMA